MDFRFPIWIITNPSGQFFAINTQQGITLLVFTEELFAERAIQELGVQSVAIVRLDTSDELKSILNDYINQGGNYVAFDSTPSLSGWHIAANELQQLIS